jgi:probable phosphoglycerate mutase
MKNTKITLLISIAAMVLLTTACAPKGDTKGYNPKGDGTVTIYVTRHGRTLFNTIDRAQGWADTPLTPEGIAVAEDLGRGVSDVKFNYVISSDLTRARQTARLVMAQNKVSDDYLLDESDMLREACYGSFEGSFNSEMLAAFVNAAGYPDMNAFYADVGMGAGWLLSADYIKKIDTSGMAEDGATIKARMQTKLRQIAEDQAKRGGGNVLLVAHGMSINIMISDMTDQYTGEGLKNASVTKIVYKDGKFDVQSINDVSYIEKGKAMR